MMTKQLITLIGALVSAAVLVLAIAFGVAPLVSGVFAADSERQQVVSTNQVYETQIASLQKQQERLDEIAASVTALQEQIPAKALLDQAFERISRAETSSGVVVVAVDRDDAAAYAPRTGTGTGEDAPPPAPAASDSQTGTPIDQADAVADTANAQADATNQQGGATGQQGGATAPAASDPNAPAAGRQQIELSIRVTAGEISQAFAFLDALRAGPRLLAIDTVTVTQANDGFDVQITALAFLQTEIAAPAVSGGEK